MHPGVHAEEQDETELAEIRARIARGLDQLDSGEGVTGTPRKIIEAAFARGVDRVRASGQP